MTKNAQKLFQLYSKTFGAEQFCFHATDADDADSKRWNWLRYHGYNDGETSKDYTVQEVESPQYENNIHDEWVT